MTSYSSSCFLEKITSKFIGIPFFVITMFNLYILTASRGRGGVLRVLQHPSPLRFRIYLLKINTTWSIIPAYLLARFSNLISHASESAELKDYEQRDGKVSSKKKSAILWMEVQHAHTPLPKVLDMPLLYSPCLGQLCYFCLSTWAETQYWVCVRTHMHTYILKSISWVSHEQSSDSCGI